MLVNPLCMLKLIDFPLFIGIIGILRVCSRVFTIHFLLCSSYKAKLRVTGTVPCHHSLLNIATPFSVKAYGAFLNPILADLDVAFCDFQFLTS